MPLKVGEKWTYIIRNAEQSVVGSILVVRSDSVAGTNGYVLQGPSGESRLAWVGSRLYAEELTNTRFDPPLPLLDTHLPKNLEYWRGSVISVGSKAGIAASASVYCLPKNLLQNGKNFDTLESNIRISVPKISETATVVSWFVSNSGLVRQEERVNGIQTSALEILSGP